MGGAKNAWMEEQERGYSSIDGDVCFECLGTGTIRNCIDQRQVEDGTCDYCSLEARVFPVSHLTEVIVERIRSEWENLYDASLPRDDETGHPILHEHECTTEEVLEEEGFSPASTQLMEDVCNAIHTDTWCERDPLDITEADALKYTWEIFCEAVKTKYRFTFFRAPDSRHDIDRDEFSLSEMLDRLREVFESIKPWAEIPEGILVFRARVKHGWKKAKDLGTPPAEYAKANRMSPEGIGMFYGAFDEKTCWREICRVEDGRYYECSLGTFQVNKTMTLLDLTKIHPVSVFDDLNGRQREFSKFLNRFQQAIAEPVEPGKPNHAVEYAPTQILTEFFRHTSMDALGKPVDGIIYNSSTNRGGRCVVLFVDHKGCGDLGDASSRLELQSAKDACVLIRPALPLTEI